MQNTPEELKFAMAMEAATFVASNPNNAKEIADGINTFVHHLYAEASVGYAEPAPEPDEAYPSGDKIDCVSVNDLTLNPGDSLEINNKTCSRQHVAYSIVNLDTEDCSLVEGFGCVGCN